MRPRALAPDALFLAVAGLAVLAAPVRPVEVGLVVALVAVVAVAAARATPLHRPLAAGYGLYGCYWLVVGLHGFRLGGLVVLGLASYHALAATVPRIGVSSGG